VAQQVLVPLLLGWVRSLPLLPLLPLLGSWVRLLPLPLRRL
jgi:hypothetical protein